MPSLAELLSYAFIVTLYLLAVLLPIVIAWGAVNAFSSARVVLGLVSVLYVFEALVVAPTPLHLGINLFPADMVFAAVLMVASLRLVRFAPALGAIGWCWLVFGLLSVALFVVGVVKHGTPAGVEFRQVFYFWVVGLYLLSFDEAQRSATVAAALGALQLLSYVLVVVALLRWADQAAGLTGVRWGLVVGANMWRVLDSDATLILALAWLWLFVRWTRGLLSLQGIAVLQGLMFVILLLQHRTVWLCTMAAVALLAVIDRDARRALLGRGLLTMMLLLAGGALLAAFGKLDEPLDALGQSVGEATSGRGSTLSWRVQSWQELITQWRAGGPTSWLFGREYGVGWWRYLVDLQNTTNHSPHSFYVRILLRGGMLGLCAVGAVYIGVFVAALRRPRGNAIQPAQTERIYVSAVMLVITVYCIAYDPDYGAALVIGLSMLVVRVPTRRVRWLPSHTNAPVSRMIEQ